MAQVQSVPAFHEIPMAVIFSVTLVVRESKDKPLDELVEKWLDKVHGEKLAKFRDVLFPEAVLCLDHGQVSACMTFLSSFCNLATGKALKFAYVTARAFTLGEKELLIQFLNETGQLILQTRIRLYRPVEWLKQEEFAKIAKKILEQHTSFRAYTYEDVASLVRRIIAKSQLY